MTYTFVTYAMGPEYYSSVRYIWKKDDIYYIAHDHQDIIYSSNNNCYLLLQDDNNNQSPIKVSHKNALSHIIQIISNEDILQGYTMVDGIKWSFNINL